MKATIVGKFLYFIDHTPQDMIWLKRILTWAPAFESKDSVEDTILFFKKDGTPYTFWGIHSLLTAMNPQIEIINPPKIQPDQGVVIPNDILPGVTLYDFQVAAVRKAVLLKQGAIVAPTGSGKSEMILATLRYLLDTGRITSALVLVPSVALADQLVERAQRRGFSNEEIAPLYGGVSEISTPIVVGVVNSVIKALTERHGEPIYQTLRAMEAVIVDETHHLSGTTYQDVCIYVDPQYLLGFSGSPYRGTEGVLSRPEDAAVHGVLGGVIFHISQKYVRDLGLISEPVIYYQKVAGKMFKFPQQYNKLYNTFIAKHEDRNRMIVTYAKKFVKLGFPTLILVNRLEHARTLLSMLDGVQATCVFGGGVGLSKDEYGLIDEHPIDYDTFRQEFSQGRWEVVIGSSVLDEGVDMPEIGAAIMGGAGKSIVKGLQRLGRGLRRKVIGANRVYVLDFEDRTHVYFQAQFKKRKKLMEEIEATILTDEIEFFKQVLEHSAQLKELKKQVENEAQT